MKLRKGMNQQKKLVQRQIGLGLKLEAFFCGLGLLGTIGYAAYIVKKYSDYVNYGGLYSGNLQGKYGLEKGLPIFPNRFVDLRDDAYRRRRRMIAAGMIYWMISSAAVKQAMSKWFPKYKSIVLVIFYGLYACYYHRGTKVLVLIFYVTANYYISRWTAGTKYGSWWVWGYNFIWLFCGKQQGVRRWMTKCVEGPLWGMGIVNLKFPLWNMTMKNISFGMDHHWARLGKPRQHAVLHKDHPEHAYKERIDHHLPLDCYSDIWAYLQFQFYPPLYTEGPIITFNDFMSQYKGLKDCNIEWKQVAWYGVRLALVYAFVEASLHYLYTDAFLMTKFYSHLLDTTSQFADPDQRPLIGCLGVTALFSCGFLLFYLKSYGEWRWGRFWSLVDGVDPPEDFVKCIARPRSMTEFWKSWHSSINKWCVRYIYIPHGGSQGTALQKHVSVALVFGFMALWHNINFDFLVWGLLLPGFIVLELVLKMKPKRMSSSETTTEDVIQTSKQHQYRSEWSGRLKDVVSIIPLLGFTIINMGAFVFGFRAFPSMLHTLTSETYAWLIFLLGVYCNQRCTSIYERWYQSQPNKTLHTN